MGFIFGGNTGETQQSLEAKRQIAMALAGQAISSSPKNLGEGLTAVGRALAYRSAMNDFMGAQSSAQQDYSSALGSILGGGASAMPSGAPSAPTAAPAPQQPQIPAAAVSGGDLTNTAQPLSGGTLPQASSGLTDAVAKLESGNSPVNGPAGGYANYRYQQFPAFVKQYGAGDDGVTNYARQVLAANPNATFGDMYGGYVTGTGNPAAANMTSLQITTQPGARGAYGNLLRNSPIDPKTPLAQLVGAPSGNTLGPQVASNNPNFVPQSSSFSNPQLAAMLSPSMTVGQQASPPAGPAMAFSGQPQSGNPLANPQAFAAPQPGAPQPVGQGTFAPPSGAQPNVTNLATQPAQLPIEGQNPGRAAVVQALQGQGQPQPMAAPASNIPPQVAETIRRLSMNPLPQAQQMASALMQRYMQPPQYDLMQGADGTVTAINKLNPRDNYVAAHVAAKPTDVRPGGALAVPDGNGGFRQVFQNQPKPTNEQLNYQYYLNTVPKDQQPMDFATWSTAKAKAGATVLSNNIDMGGPQSYDKQLAEGLAKSHAALSNGVEDAQTRARDIAAMQGALDQIQKNGGTTGGMGQEQILNLKKTINNGATVLGITQPFSEADISDKEFLQKFNRQMAGAQAKGAVGSRVTNFELSNFMKANPGIDMSITGGQRLLGIQAQIERRNIAVGNAIRNATAQAISSGARINPVQVQKIITDYDQQHHITDPITGQDLTQSYTLPEFQTGGTNPQKAQEHNQNVQKLQGKTQSGLQWSVH